VKTTYDNNGHAAVIRTSGVTSSILISGSTSNGLTLTIDIETLVCSVSKIILSVANPGTTAKTFDLGIYADTQVAGADTVPAVWFSDRGRVGLNSSLDILPVGGSFTTMWSGSRSSLSAASRWNTSGAGASTVDAIAMSYQGVRVDPGKFDCAAGAVCCVGFLNADAVVSPRGGGPGQFGVGHEDLQ
jgi:hypothetical protein